MSSTNISSILRENVQASDLYGGDILKLRDMMKPLAQKYSHDMLENNENENWEFIENIFIVTDVLLNSTIAWMEVTNATKRYNCSSKFVSNVDNIGHLFLTSLHTPGCLPSLLNFTSPHLTVQMINLAQHCFLPMCFSFFTGTICVPPTVYESFNKDNVANVATEFVINNIDEVIFPENMLNNMNNQSSIIGLSLENGTSILIAEDNEPIRIIFQSEDIESERNCVSWDLSEDYWSGVGCYYNQDISNDSQSTCDCFHLTNFGIIMDFTGQANPFNIFLDYFSTITMIISMIFIFTTELVLFYLK